MSSRLAIAGLICTLACPAMPLADADDDEDDAPGATETVASDESSDSGQAARDLDADIPERLARDKLENEFVSDYVDAKQEQADDLDKSMAIPNRVLGAIELWQVKNDTDAETYAQDRVAEDRLKEETKAANEQRWREEAKDQLEKARDQRARLSTPPAPTQGASSCPPGKACGASAR